MKYAAEHPTSNIYLKKSIVDRRPTLKRWEEAKSALAPSFLNKERKCEQEGRENFIINVY
jgi:hypothetical protein